MVQRIVLFHYLKTSSQNHRRSVYLICVNNIPSLAFGFVYFFFEIMDQSNISPACPAQQLDAGNTLRNACCIAGMVQFIYPPLSLRQESPPSRRQKVCQLIFSALTRYTLLRHE